jgi:hypothetical protein
MVWCYDGAITDESLIKPDLSDKLPKWRIGGTLSLNVCSVFISGLPIYRASTYGPIRTLNVILEIQKCPL